MRNSAKFTNPAVLIISSILIVLCTVLFSIKIWAVDTKETQETSTDVEIIENENPIDIEKILEENTSTTIVQEMVVEEIDLEYTTEYRNNSELPSGTMQVIQEGRDGRQNAVIIKKYENDELISEELVAENLIKASVNKIVEIGTGYGTSYTPAVGDTVYVTSSTLAVRLEPDSSAEKVCTLKQGTEVKIKKIEGDWLYITSSEKNGYVQANCVTNVNPNATNEEDTEITGTYTKSELLAKLSFDMDLSKPSGFSLEQFKKVLQNQSYDTNGVFSDNAEYFYYAEKQYGINGIFLAAVGIHESGWGTSNISLNKKNLFGYGASDSNPYGGAYTFSTYSEGIDLLARVFVKYYLNPAGTSIYDGNTADGKYYSGNTLSSVNKRYASDSNWANSVYKWMTYLYNSL